MGRNKAVFKLGKTSIVRRLYGENIQSGTGDTLLGKSIIQSILIDNSAASAIDQSDRRLHHLDLFGINHIQSLCIFRHVDCNIIRLPEDSFKAVDYFKTEFFRIGGGGTRGDTPELSF